MKIHFELSIIKQLDLDMCLRKICLIMIILDLTRSYGDINMHIIELFKKAYIRYN